MQYKVFYLLLLSLVLGSSFDTQKIMSLILMLAFWVVHWLVSMRSDFLVKDHRRNVVDHAKMLVLQMFMTCVTFVVSLLFYKQFRMELEN